MHRKTYFNFEFKSVEEKDGKVKVKGFASTPDIDRQDDIVDTKAFENSMSIYMKNPQVLLQHDSDKPIGRVLEYTLDSKGLEVTAEITENTDGVIDKINNKVLGAFSIGFRAKKWEMTEKEVNGEIRHIREIKELDLVEISIVSTPANPNAVFTITKSLKKLFDLIEKEGAIEAENMAKLMNEIDEEGEDEKVDEIAEDEKACKPKRKKMKTEKSFIEEKRVLLSGELFVGDIVRFTKCEYDEWCMMTGECEIEVEVGEVIKIVENEDVTNPTLYILEYELSLDGFVPSDEMCVCNFRDTVIEKITPNQLKEFEAERQEADQIETQSEEPETQPETADAEAGQTEEENSVEINIEAEVEKCFAKKSIAFDESLEAKEQKLADIFAQKMADIEAKELAVKSIYNEVSEMKSVTAQKVEEAKQIMERLLKIAINKGVIAKGQPKYTFNYFTQK